MQYIFTKYWEHSGFYNCDCNDFNLFHLPLFPVLDVSLNLSLNATQNKKKSYSAKYALLTSHDLFWIYFNRSIFAQILSFFQWFPNIFCSRDNNSHIALLPFMQKIMLFSQHTYMGQGAIFGGGRIPWIFTWNPCLHHNYSSKKRSLDTLRVWVCLKTSKLN